MRYSIYKPREGKHKEILGISIVCDRVNVQLNIPDEEVWKHSLYVSDSQHVHACDWGWRC